MFDPKNLSPRELSFYTALAIAVPVSVFVYLLKADWELALILLAVLLLGGDFLVSFVLERFIYRKIKLIYKFIYKTKATRREETYYKYILPKKRLNEWPAAGEPGATETKKQMRILERTDKSRPRFFQTWPTNFKRPFLQFKAMWKHCCTAIWKIPS